MIQDEISSDYYGSKLEFAFLEQYQNLGAFMYKANNDLTNWTKLELQPESGYFPPMSIKETLQLKKSKSDEKGINYSTVGYLLFF